MVPSSCLPPSLVGFHEVLFIPIKLLHRWWHHNRPYLFDIFLLKKYNICDYPCRKKYEIVYFKKKSLRKSKHIHFTASMQITCMKASKFCATQTRSAPTFAIFCFLPLISKLDVQYSDVSGRKMIRLCPDPVCVLLE